jgi:hypothetical protein
MMTLLIPNADTASMNRFNPSVVDDGCPMLALKYCSIFDWLRLSVPINPDNDNAKALYSSSSLLSKP